MVLHGSLGEGLLIIYFNSYALIMDSPDTKQCIGITYGVDASEPRNPGILISWKLSMMSEVDGRFLGVVLIYNRVSTDDGIISVGRSELIGRPLLLSYVEMTTSVYRSLA